jgi:threonyl-tRNA synthetase
MPDKPPAPKVERKPPSKLAGKKVPGVRTPPAPRATKAAQPAAVSGAVADVVPAPRIPAAAAPPPPTPMVTLTMPDGATRQIAPGTTGLAVAKAIAPSLAKRSVAMVLDGVICDLSDTIHADAAIRFVSRADREALDLIRHDCAHVLAEAVQQIWPGTQVTIGPVIENGFFYDFAKAEPFQPDDMARIEQTMHTIIAQNAPFTKEVWSREDARAYFAAQGEHFKVELVDAIPAGEDVKIYRQGDWLDLCRGPHMTSTGQIGTAFKLTKFAGSYWRGDQNNAQLQRVYGIAFASQADLDAHLTQQEEAEKRDHRKLGRELDLFHFQEEAPGSVFWHPKGWTLFQTLVGYVRRRADAAGYREVNTPDLMERTFWELSGHWQNYGDKMFVTETEDERVFCCKPMNCPGHVQVFKHGLKSYRDLPLKLAEFGKVHRYEASGALHGLLRVRHFTQDDGHIFVTEDQIEAECLAINDMMLSIYGHFGFDEITIKLSTRPEKRVGSDDLWDKAEAALQQVLDRVTATSGSGVRTAVNPGEGAFYGPKLEYVLRDAIGREWQCGTTQVDFNLAGRLDAFYIDETSQRRTPVMIHRAMFGSLERFTGILIENFAGAFPLWLAPVQVMVCPIVSDANDYAAEVVAACRQAGLRVEQDLRNEKITYKVREHSLAKVPVLLVVGKREADDRSVSVRRFGSHEQRSAGLTEAVAALVREATPPDLAA